MHPVRPEAGVEQELAGGVIFRAPAVDLSADMHLIASAKLGDLNGVVKALEAGADLETRGMWDSTALVAACQHGHVHVAEALLDRGANGAARNSRGATPLLFACIHGWTSLAERLGPAVSGRVYNPATDATEELAPLVAAASNGRDELCDSLYDEASADEALSKAVALGQTACVRVLLERGATLASSCLLEAASNGCEGSLLVALARADADAVSYAHPGSSTTALHAACARGLGEAALALAKRCPTTLLDAVDDRGSTPFLLATARCLPAVVETLLQAGVDSTVVDKHGRDARTLAARHPASEDSARLHRLLASTPAAKSDATQAAVPTFDAPRPPSDRQSRPPNQVRLQRIAGA